MTKIENEEIFAKECLTIADFEKLYGCNYEEARSIMVDLKNRLMLGKKQTLRLTVRGKIHKADYFEALNIPLAVGYGVPFKQGE